jgi:ubiquinone/menaquinone biosynthesis C-methylase UbiE
MHKFSAENYERLEKDERYTLVQPEQTLRQCGLQQGMTLIDIGAGTGFFSRAASKIVGDQGAVYAADISIDMLSAFRKYGVPENTHLVPTTEFEVPLAMGIADIVLFAFVLHECADIPRILAEAGRLLKPGGRIVAIEWKKQTEQQGPPAGERLSPQELLSACAPWTVRSSGDLNPSHYFSILQIP